MCLRPSACCSESRKSFAVNVEGACRSGVTAKDLILAIIGQIGVSGGTGHVLEYRGATIRALSMEERMTVCNMSIEAGARAGMIAAGRNHLRLSRAIGRAHRKGAAWDDAAALTGARSRPMPMRRSTRPIDIDAAALEPMITYGTNPGMVRADRRRHPGTSAAMRSTPRRSATWGSTPARRCSASP